LSNIFNTEAKTDSNIPKDVSQKSRKQLVLEGIDIIFSLFTAVGQQRLFPRKIMTKYTKGQMTVYSKQQVIYWFETANYHDCRINAYPAFVSEAEEQDYKQGINLNLLTPNILFIDLDLEHFKSRDELDIWLNRILKNIANFLHGANPLVLWSGHGYHIIIPVKATEALEQFEDFEPYTSEPSKNFLQFVTRYLSLNKGDDKNNPAFGSCLLRVPYTFNSKCLDEKKDAEVKIIQQCNSSQVEQMPEIDNLLIEFQTFLIDKKLKAEINQNKTRRRNGITNPLNTTNTIPYVEKLLGTQIADHRKFVISLILAPYFINIQHLSYADSVVKIKQWTLKCNEIRKLEPSIEYFDDLIKGTIERAKNTHIKPLKFEDTLQYKNRELYDTLL
jgi:hypothetical protein